MTNNHEEIVTNQQIDLIQDASLLGSLKAVSSKHQSKSATGESVISVVNTPEHGRRVTISANLISALGSPTTVQIAVNDKGIAIGSQLPDNDSSFMLRKTGSKAVIYSKELVNELTSLFDLDFIGKTSISFYEVTYLTINDAEVAFVPLRK
ncbi:hypothetical protein ABE504_26660 [Paenibacillus oryzisoli]|uniref:hypothetical protein n=1 Tax=Paenibacillus oryzisoli TaxID=1850517 RepID=UPI003D282952